MAKEDVITDPTLLSALAAADRARRQGQEIIQLLDSYHSDSSQEFASLPEDVEMQVARAQRQISGELGKVRTLHRRALQGIREEKAKTAEARHEVDTLHLQLQNLYYEQRHLNGEINACESYDHKYQSLPLIPEADFLALYPEHESLTPHELMIKRIEHEHAERQALEEKRQGLLKKKQGLIAANNDRKKKLANLDELLEKFIEAAEPIEKIFEQGLVG